MKRFLLLPSVAFFLLFFTGCPNYGYRYDQGKFPNDPVNLESANSIYDDYNMASPVIEGNRYLYFSSNRNSQGNDFDIVGNNFHILWDKDKGTLDVDDHPDYWKNYDYVDTLFARMNTPSNEYGPYSLPWNYYEALLYGYTDMIVYSNDESGNQDIKVVWFKGAGENPTPAEGTFGGPEPVSFLNTGFNDAYVSFYGPYYGIDQYGIDPANITEIYFCSDRDGDYNIYQAAVPADSSILGFLLSDIVVPVTAVGKINSVNQDKCPYVKGQMMVFTSDRPGGYGGFDLYYSLREGDGWSDPVNFGERINTAYNEYRPIVMKYDEFQDDLMLFSSDRPGGNGGYDLYYVGISKMTE